jgi:polyribonucleotide nucleotidyltransferase
MATYGETTVLCTAVVRKKPKPGQDFFPLTVNYQEKASPRARSPAASSSVRAAQREGDLTSRLIDRPIRPLFHEASATRRWSSRPCWPTTSRTIPTSWR